MAIKRIIVKGNESCIQKEAKVSTAVITPGYLVQLDTAAGTVKPHGTAAGFAQKAFAVEAGFIGNDIDDDYAVGDECIYVVCASGVEINALVAGGTAEITKGDALISTGNGTLETIASATTQGQIVALALETVDNSVPATEARILVEVV